MLTTDPQTPPQASKATLHDRIEHDRSENDAGQPAHSQGSGTTRIAALIAAAKARGAKSS
jgi:hypothetical protein